ncbi:MULTISPECIES: EMYY motif lipoprotein [Staphylococcus]|uniref:EMYY motif lipoprotein n=1 Tax=Staphylococcus hsinchuensis TaxID=3051183 RepID=A0ABZ3EFB1_9STAP|nr:EMYY motif lipoprotein [Staphylococcus sp. Marseille-Q6910]
MKKIVYITLLFSVAIILNACGNGNGSDFKKFKESYAKVEQKDQELQNTVDDIQLGRLNDLSESQLTDKNKKEFNDIQNKVNRKLIKKFDEYKQSAEKLPATSEDTKTLKKEYMKTVNRKKDAIYEVKSYVDLYNQSIKANEDILDYTKLFEKNRAFVEDDIKRANSAGESDEVNKLKHKIAETNKKLKAKSENTLGDSVSHGSQQAIDDEIMPLITDQIRELNKLELKDGYANNARKNAIEMYYSLQNYYETRGETIANGEKIDKINRDKLLKNGEDLEHYNESFKEKYQSIKVKYE